MASDLNTGQLQQFDFGRVITRAFLCLRRNFIPFIFAGAVIVGLPVLMITIYAYVKLSGVFAGEEALESLSENLGTLAVWGGISLALTLVTNAVLLGALTYGSIRDFNEERSELGELLRIGLKYALPLIGLSILSGLGMVLGFMFFIIPGFLLMCAWFVLTPALVMENTGVIGAFGRSAELTSGYRWWLFLALILYGMASYFLTALGEAIGQPLGISGEAIMLQEEVNMVAIVAASVMGVFVQVLQSVLMTVGIASVYYELRYIKEGIHPESIVAVFD